MPQRVPLVQLEPVKPDKTIKGIDREEAQRIVEAARSTRRLVGAIGWRWAMRSD